MLSGPTSLNNKQSQQLLSMVDRYLERHDKYVRQLTKKLLESEHYDLVGTFLKYHDNDRLIGEIDVYGIRLRESQLDIYEVKGNRSGKYRSKGKEQLARASDFLSPGFTTINTYLYLAGKIKAP